MHQSFYLRSCSKGALTGPRVCLIAELLLIITLLDCKVDIGTGDTMAKGPGMPQLYECS